MMRQSTAVGLLAILAFSPALFAQRRGDTSTPTATGNANFDPRDLNGSWLDTKQGVGDDNKTPEPPLTPWAKEHLLIKEGISHAGLNATARGELSSQSQEKNSVDENGIPTNVAGGHYPGEKCEPEGAPVQYNYTNLYPMQFIILPDRIYQMFENHREWRTIWLDRDHPKDLFPSYLGDSVAKWEGNTLVIDTTGFNSHQWISENIGHYMSDAFHLIERFHLTDSTHMELEMTYYDPKAWGDNAWPGWKREFRLRSKTDVLEEQVCDPATWSNYDSVIAAPIKAGNK